MESYNVYYPGSPHESAPGYLPGKAAFNYSEWMHLGHTLHSQSPESAEITQLRTRLAMAESRLVEMQEDVTEAKTVIDYLLKLNACNYSLGHNGLPQHTSSAVEEAKGILTPIIGLLQDIVRAGLSSREQLFHSEIRPTLKSGNLIDLPNEEPRPEQVAKDSWGQPDLISFDSNTLLPAPLVARFRNVRHRSADAKGNFAEHPPEVFLLLWLLSWKMLIIYHRPARGQSSD